MIIFSKHPEALEDEIFMGINRGNSQDYLSFKTVRKGKVFDLQTQAYLVFVKKEEVADRAVPVEEYNKLDISFLHGSDAYPATITSEEYHEQLRMLPCLTRHITRFVGERG
jgi:hypothetical protein